MENKRRFTERVADYVKYRPSYPEEAIDFLYGPVGFDAVDTIADIGAGTGIFSRLLLERGSAVIALEPNAAMRAAAEVSCGGQRYRSLPGAAEETGLANGTVDHLVCAQSFHWFDREVARKEFRRILKPSGHAALIWNTRKTTGTSLLEQFEGLLLKYAAEYEKVSHRSINEQTLKPFFAGDGPKVARFAIRQRLDEEGLAGRVLSSSYSPLRGSERCEAMLRELKGIFDEHQRQGYVTLDYETVLYWGEVSDAPLSS